MREIRKDAAFLSGVKLEETLILYAATMCLDNIVVGPNQGTLLCREIGGAGKCEVACGHRNRKWALHWLPSKPFIVSIAGMLSGRERQDSLCMISRHNNMKQNWRDCVLKKDELSFFISCKG